MAPLMVSDTGFAGNLKNYYTRFREDLFPVLDRLFAQFQKIKSGGPRNMRWQGNGAYFDAVVGDPVGWHYSSAGWLPDSAFRSEVQGVVGIARLYVRQEIDGLTVPATSSKQGAYVTIAQKIDEEMRMKFRLGIQEGLHGDGTGIKAVIGTASSSTSIIVASPYGIASSGQGALWLSIGMQVAVLDASASFASLGTTSITAVARVGSTDSYTLTLSPAVSGMAANDILVSASDNDTSYNSYINGLTNLTNRGGSYGTLHGINVATSGNARWNTTRLTAGTDTPRADQFLEHDVWELASRVAAFSGHNALTDPSDFIIVTTTGLKKSIAESVQGQRQLSLAQTQNTLKGGYAVDVSINNIPVIDDPYCPAGTVYLLHLPSIGWVDGQELGAVSYNDSGTWRPVANRDAYETSQSMYFNVCTTKRSAHGLITNYVDNNRYTPVASA